MCEHLFKMQILKNPFDYILFTDLSNIHKQIYENQYSHFEGLYNKHCDRRILYLRLSEIRICKFKKEKITIKFDRF